MGVEMQILYAIQKIHTDWLSDFMLFLSKINDHGEVWIAICLVLLLFPKTRKCGACAACALALTYVLGTEVLKNLIKRPRPFMVDGRVSLLLMAPHGYSFPSGHTSSSFATAMAIFLYYRKAGIAAFVLAGMIAFSRMYLFVHFPTDILGGMALGMLDAWLISLLFEKISKRSCEKE